MNLRQSLDYTKAEIQRERMAFLNQRIIELMQECECSNVIAAQTAIDEFDEQLHAKAPGCWNCEFASAEQTDPFGTGDSPSIKECLAGECPWGKKGWGA